MKQYLIYTLALISLSCNQKPNDRLDEEVVPESSEVKFSPKQWSNAAMESDYIKEGTLPGFLNVNGVIDVPPQNMVSISFPLGGYLKSTHLLPGMYVKKGEIIATIEDPSLVQLQQDFLEVNNRIQYAEKEFIRQKELNANKTSSDKLLEQAQSQLESLKIQEQGLKSKLSLIKISTKDLLSKGIQNEIPIHSPIRGYVADVKVNIGKYVNPSDVLFELVNPADLHLSLRVFEKDLQHLKIGQRVDARLVSQPNKKIAASIILISKKMDENRSNLVHCHLDKDDETLIPGMFIQANIAVDKKVGGLVSESAVVQWGNNKFVFIETAEKTFEMRAVNVLAEQAGYVLLEMTGQLKEKKIITKNAYSALMLLQNKGEEE